MRGGSSLSRRSLRQRKVSERIAVVDHDARKEAVAARLDALEQDTATAIGLAEDPSDDEFIFEEDEDEGELGSSKSKRRKQGGPRRLTRGSKSEKAATGFAQLLEEADLGKLPEHQPSYFTAAAKPGVSCAPRKFCQVCGSFGKYNCTRCGTPFCSKRCHLVHTETRCLTFLA